MLQTGRKLEDSDAYSPGDSTIFVQGVNPLSFLSRVAILFFIDFECGKTLQNSRRIISNENYKYLSYWDFWKSVLIKVWLARDHFILLMMWMIESSILGIFFSPDSENPSREEDLEGIRTLKEKWNSLRKLERKRVIFCEIFSPASQRFKGSAFWKIPFSKTSQNSPPQIRALQWAIYRLGGCVSVPLKISKVCQFSFTAKLF